MISTTSSTRSRLSGRQYDGQRARTVHVFGDDVAAAVFFAGVVDRKDVRVLQHADHVRFRQEHLAGDLGALIARILVHVVDLDRDVAAVIRIVREIDGAGGTPADLIDDYIFTNAIRNAVFQDLLRLRFGARGCCLQRHLCDVTNASAQAFPNCAVPCKGVGRIRPPALRGCDPFPGSLVALKRPGAHVTARSGRNRPPRTASHHRVRILLRHHRPRGCRSASPVPGPARRHWSSPRAAPGGR